MKVLAKPAKSIRVKSIRVVKSGSSMLIVIKARIL